MELAVGNFQGHVSSPPQGPAVQLLLWQVLQQLQASETDGNYCPSLMEELRIQKTKLNHAKMHHEHLEDESAAQITRFKHHWRICDLQAENLKLELEVKASKLELLERELSSEREARIKLETEQEKTIKTLFDEKELRINLEQELDKLNKQLKKEKVGRNATEDELGGIKNQMNKEKDLRVMMEKELDKERKRVFELEVTVTNQTKERLAGERQYVQDIHVLKEKLNAYDRDTSAKECEDMKKNLQEERNKSKELEEKLNREITKVHYLQIELSHEKGSAADLKEDLKRERNKTEEIKSSLGKGMAEVTELKIKLELEKNNSLEDQNRRQEVENNLREVKQMFIKCREYDELAPLHKAAKVCDLEEAKILVRRGVSASQPTTGYPTKWTTAVHLAAQVGCADMVDWFAQNKTLLKVQNENGATPLHEAAYYSKPNIVKMLLDRGAQINAKDKEGKTSLDYAHTRSNTDIVNLLVERGADTVPNVEDHYKNYSYENDLYY